MVGLWCTHVMKTEEHIRSNTIFSCRTLFGVEIFMERQRNAGVLSVIRPRKPSQFSFSIEILWLYIFFSLIFDWLGFLIKVFRYSIDLFLVLGFNGGTICNLKTFLGRLGPWMNYFMKFVDGFVILNYVSFQLKILRFKTSSVFLFWDVVLTGGGCFFVFLLIRITVKAS